MLPARTGTAQPETISWPIAADTRELGGAAVQIGEPHRASVAPCPLGQFGVAGQRQAHACLDESFRLPARNSPRGSEFELLLLGANHPFNGHIPSLGDAKGLKDAHARRLDRCVFPHNLAHRELQRQPVFALLLLGNVAQQAAHRQRNARLLPPAQAQFQIQHAAVRRIVAQRRPLHRLAIQRAAEKRGHLAPGTGREQVLEGMRDSPAPFGPVRNSASTPDSHRRNCPAGLSVAIISLECSNRSR